MLPITALPASSLQQIFGNVLVGDKIRDPLTFAQIYKAVENNQFQVILDYDLAQLDYSELNALKSLVARRIQFFSELAEKQRVNPKLKPPEGVPDMIYKNVVLEYKEFLKRLNLTLDPVERRQKAYGLFEPWIAQVYVAFPMQPIAEAVKQTLDVTFAIVTARLNNEQFHISDEGIIRLGYISKAGFDALDGQLGPEGSAEERQLAWFWRMVRAIKEFRSILPLEIAEGRMTSGSGDRNDAHEFINKVRRIDDDIKKGAAEAKANQVGSIPLTPMRGTCANAIFYWMSQLADKTQNPKSVYSSYSEFLAGTAGAPF